MSDSSNKMHVTDGSFAIGNTQQHIDNQTIENQVVNNYLTQPQSDEKKPERIITCGDYDKALEHYKKALVIVEKVLDPEHPSTAATYNNIALFYRAKGDYDKALEYSKKIWQSAKRCWIQIILTHASLTSQSRAFTALWVTRKKNRSTF